MIRLKNIHKSFGKNHVLKGIDLEVEKGEVTVIIGPSGSGKSTLLRCINFLEKPSQGEIAVGDTVIDCEKPNKKEILAIRRKTAMVFQNYCLFKNKTILENVMEALVTVQRLPESTARERSMTFLHKVGLTDKANVYPSQISGGQQQRAGIARALAVRPQVILFDEPTSALDPELVGDILKIIKNIAREEHITMMIVTHEMSFAHDIANRMIFMEDGVIVEQGTPDELFLNPKEERTRQFLRRFTQEWTYTV